MKEEKKNYTQAPLPFMGQKRRWNQDFKRILKTEFTDCNTFVDLYTIYRISVPKSDSMYVAWNEKFTQNIR